MDRGTEALARVERIAAPLRVLVVALAGLLYLVVGLPPGVSRLPADAVLATGTLYSVGLVVARPVERWSPRATSMAISALDGGFLAAWIYVTGAGGSPYHVIWYVATVTLAFRFDLWETLVGSGIFALVDAMLLLNVGHAAPLATALQVLFIPVTGLLAGLLAREVARHRDVAAVERAEADQQRRTSQRLEEALALNRALLEATSDGILVVDDGDRILHWNDAWADLWEVPRELLESGDGAAVREASGRLLEDPHGVAAEAAPLYGSAVESNDRLELRDGRVLERRGAPVYLDGELRARMWMYRDITEAERGRRSLQRSNEELERFAYAVSHDLREPLRMVTSYLQLLERRLGDRLEAEERELMDIAVDGGRRMDTMIQALLAYARLESSETDLAEVELDDVAEAALANLQMAVDDAGATVEVAPLPAVRGDEVQLTLLLQNLVGNALRHGGADGEPRVLVRARTGPEEVELEVVDDGPGVPVGDRERIFRFFERGDATGGTGMGLALCRKIVERHGGRIWVAEGEDGGASFRFTLPLADGDQPPT